MNFVGSFYYLSLRMFLTALCLSKTLGPLDSFNANYYWMKQTSLFETLRPPDKFEQVE